MLTEKCKDCELRYDKLRIGQVVHCVIYDVLFQHNLALFSLLKYFMTNDIYIYI